jgi:hypothetical protein
MGTAAERSGIVNQAIASSGIKQRTCARRIMRQGFATRRAQGVRCEQRFSFGQVGSAAGQFEMAAFLQAHAIAIDWSRREIRIDLADFIKDGVHS